MNCPTGGFAPGCAISCARIRQSAAGVHRFRLADRIVYQSEFSRAWWERV
jgi:hypothetical protein